VIDDGSIDRSAEIARSYGPPVRCISTAPQGLAIARNLGIEAACGEYVGFLDADDHWPADRLSVQLEEIESPPPIDMVFGHELRFPADGRRPLAARTGATMLDLWPSRPTALSGGCPSARTGTPAWRARSASLPGGTTTTVPPGCPGSAGGTGAPFGCAGVTGAPLCTGGVAFGATTGVVTGFCTSVRALPRPPRPVQSDGAIVSTSSSDQRM